MLRKTRWVVSMGLLGAVLAGSGASSLMAFEMQEHGAGGAEAKMAKAEHVEPEQAEKINPLEIKPGLAIWTFVVFVLLMTVLGRYAWKPLLEALHSREQHLEHVLLETERARNESEANLAEHRKLMARAGDDVRAILEKARKEAEATAEQLIKQAQGEAELAKQRAQRDIGSARDQALAEIWEKTADMAVSVAGKVLSKELSDTEHRRLLEVAINELPAQGATNGQGGKRA